MRITYDKNMFLDIANKLSKLPAPIKSNTSFPSLETFNDILEKAKEGNEMAVLQIHEWQKYCKPTNTNEKRVADMADTALNELFSGSIKHK